MYYDTGGVIHPIIKAVQWAQLRVFWTSAHQDAHNKARGRGVRKRGGVSGRKRWSLSDRKDGWCVIEREGVRPREGERPTCRESASQVFDFATLQNSLALVFVFIFAANFPTCNPDSR